MVRFSLYSLLLVCCQFARADENDLPEAAPPLQSVSIDGVVVSVAPQGLVIRTEEGVDYAASADPKRIYKKINYTDVPLPEVSVTGPGNPTHVVAGAFTDFEMDLGPRRETRFVIPSLKLFTATEESVLGCFARRAEGGVADEPTPFVQVGEGRWRIVGRIAALRGNDIAIAVPGGTISGRIANTPLVTLEVADHRFARPGDRAVLQGLSPELPHVFATQLTVVRDGKPLAIPPLAEPPQGEQVAVGDGGAIDVDPGNFPAPGDDADDSADVKVEAPATPENTAAAWAARWTTEKRTWTDKSGKYTVDAVYDDYLGEGKIRVLREDMSAIVIELSKLSDADRRAAVALRRAKQE